MPRPHWVPDYPKEPLILKPILTETHPLSFVEDPAVPNDEDINDEIKIDDYNSLASDIDPLRNEIL